MSFSNFSGTEGVRGFPKKVLSTKFKFHICLLRLDYTELFFFKTGGSVIFMQKTLSLSRVWLVKKRLKPFN